MNILVSMMAVLMICLKQSSYLEPTYVLSLNTLVHSLVESLLTNVTFSFQILLLTAVKDVANSLAELMNAARITSGKNSSDQAWESLKNCAKVSQLSLLHYKDCLVTIRAHTLGHGDQGQCTFENCEERGR